MGSRNLDRISLDEWRRHGETIADMWRNKWRVHAYCETCAVELRVDLEAAIRLNGPGLSLWNRTTSCKRAGCSGRMFFKARPPEANTFGYLGKRWPRIRAPQRDPLAFGPGPMVDPSPDDGLG